MDCEVTRLVRDLCRQLNRSDQEVLPHLHRIVTLNWIESLDDLDLVSEDHWADWEVPEKLVISIKAAVSARRQDMMKASLGSAVTWLWGGSARSADDAPDNGTPNGART